MTTTKRGFLLVSSGAPDAPTETALSTYLEEFQRDPLATTVPQLHAPLVNWVTISRHINEMVAAYASIWMETRSPLIHYCSRLAQKLEMKLEVPVVVGMAHGNPSLTSAVASLLDAGVDEICLLWLFPQYDISKQYCVESITKELKHTRSSAGLRVAPAFYNEPSFISPLAEQLRDTEDYVLFNYHGLSTHSLKLADPTHYHCLAAPTCCNDPSLAHDTCYRFQCLSTSKSIAHAADIAVERYSTSFQTRLKHGKWLEPYTEDVLRQLPSQGEKKVTVLSPSYFCDGLETLEELQLRDKYVFLEAGGESFRMIPCLNDSPAALDCLQTMMAKADQWSKEWTPTHETDVIGT